METSANASPTRTTYIRGSLLGLVAALVATPIAAAVVAWRKGWMPYGDEAAVTAQSWGALSKHPPLVGVYSSATSATASSQILYHPGPLQLWLLSPLAHLLAPSNVGVLFASALLVSLSLLTVLGVAWRQGGAGFVAPTAVMLAWWVHAATAAALHSPYADALGAFMLAAFLAAAWAVLNRDELFWPVFIVAASISAQAEVVYLIPIGIVSLLVLTVRLICWGRGRRSPAHGEQRLPRCRAWAHWCGSGPTWAGLLVRSAL